MLSIVDIKNLIGIINPYDLISSHNGLKLELRINLEIEQKKGNTVVHYIQTFIENENNTPYNTHKRNSAEYMDNMITKYGIDKYKNRLFLILLLNFTENKMLDKYDLIFQYSYNEATGRFEDHILQQIY